MKSRRIYVLVVVLGLAMVWLGMLFTYELKLAQKNSAAQEQLAEAPEKSLLPTETAEEMQPAGFNRGDAVKEAGAGFPLVLAGLGIVLVVGGAKRCRQ